MDFVKFMTNTGLHLVNSKILNSLNYKSLKNLCQASKEIEDYIRDHCEKWKLLEKSFQLRRRGVKNND